MQKFLNMNIRLYIWILTGIIFTTIFNSCTDLKEDVFSEITSDDFAKNPQAGDLLIGNAYTKMNALTYEPYFFNEFTTDEMRIPFRTQTGEWGGGGRKWPQLYQHAWQADHGDLNKVWLKEFDIVNQSNVALDLLQKLGLEPDLEQKLVSEVKAIRAYGYLWLIDNFGRVPIVESLELPIDSIKQSSRAEVYSFIESELEENVKYLSSTRKYGKFDKFSTWAVMAKLYLNAEVYAGLNRYDKAIAMCDSIINSGQFELADDYFSNFSAHNEGSKENILVIPFDAVYSGTGFALARYALHESERVIYNAEDKIWNGISALPSMVKAFDDGDVRKNGWLSGYQIYNGDTLRCIKGNSTYPNGTKFPLNFTVDWLDEYGNPIVNPADLTYEFSGARFHKYEFEQGLITTQMNNDFVLIRYADVLMMKAEALMRKSGGAASPEAVDLVNQIRNRAFGQAVNYYTISNLTLDTLCKERKLEFYGEGFRRSDLVRFDKFYQADWEFKSYGEHADGEPFINLFPIPRDQLNTNANLTQNPGYN